MSKSHRARNPYDPPEEKKDDSAHYEKAGASLLSEQDPDPELKQSSNEEIKTWGILRGHLEARLMSLLTWRSSWWNTNWSDLAQYIEPRRSLWLTQSTGGIPSPNNMSRGKPINSSIIDPTGTYAVRICSSGMMSGLASPSRPWFKIVPSVKGAQIDAEGRAWLDEVEDRIYTILAGSNFYNSFAQECEDLVVFGTAPVIIYEDERDVIRCYNPAIGEYYLSSGATLRVEGLYRTFVMTITQIVDFFGVENCPDDVQGLWAQKGSALETERIIAHSIEPNFAINKDDAGKVHGHFAWREVYWVYGAGSEHPLSMRGFVDQPFSAGRWATQSNDAYGRSVGMDVLPDIIQLQVETLRKAQAIEKMSNPPLIASMDLKNQPSSSIPGAVTYAQNIQTAGMKPIYEVNPRIAEMMNDIKEIQVRIEKGFFNDVILMLSTNPGDRRTAYEVAQLMAERLQVLGPVIENIITESLKPKLKRIFGIIKRRNMLPAPPDSIKDMELDVEFISMLALAQKGSATGGLERLASLIGNMSAVFPEAKNKLNVNNFIDTMNNLLDNPQSVLYSNDEVAKIMEAQNQQMEQEKSKQDVAGMAQTAAVGADAAKTLSDTQIGGGASALQQLLGG